MILAWLACMLTAVAFLFALGLDLHALIVLTAALAMAGVLLYVIRPSPHDKLGAGQFPRRTDRQPQQKDTAQGRTGERNEEGT